MFPCHEGITTSQMIVVSRLLDTELWKNGEELYWHKLWSVIHNGKELSLSTQKKADDMYVKFLREMKYTGFHPELSHLQMAQLPILGQNDGTHRLGYLLSESENIFVPVKIMPKPQGLWFPLNGAGFLLERGISETDLNKLLNRCNELRKNMRKYVSALVKKSVMDEKQSIVIAELSQISHILTVKNITLRSETRWGHYQKSLLPGEYSQIRIEPNYQIMYCKDGVIKSQIIDTLSARLESRLGENWGYIAGTVTESVIMENALFAVMSYEEGREN